MQKPLAELQRACGMSHLTRLSKYIDKYLDAPSWGGPTYYPPTPDIEDFKAIRDDLTLLEELRHILDGAEQFGASLVEFDAVFETPTAAQKFYRAIYKIRNGEYPKSLDEEPFEQV
jgi:hypothetical protein